MDTPLRDPTYAWTKKLVGKSLDEARALVADALKDQGFGVLTEIDVRATFHKKLNLDFRPYVILGVCNPQLAHRALATDLSVGLFLPCNVCLWQDGDATVVAFQRPDVMFHVVDLPDLAPIADDATQRLRAAFERIN